MHKDPKAAGTLISALGTSYAAKLEYLLALNFPGLDEEIATPSPNLNEAGVSGVGR